MSFNTFYSCPGDCTEVQLPALPADPYCVGVPGLSQVGSLIIVPCGVDDPFIDNASVIELNPTSPIDNTSSDNSSPHQLVGRGGVDEHEALEYEGPLRKNIVWLRRYTLNMEIPIPANAAGDSLYSYMQSLQCGSIDYRFFYIDTENKLYGLVTADAEGGILPMMTNVQMPKGNGTDDLQVATISITWESKTGDPNRYASPIDIMFESCGGAP